MKQTIGNSDVSVCLRIFSGIRIVTMANGPISPVLEGPEKCYGWTDRVPRVDYLRVGNSYCRRRPGLETNQQ